MPPSEEPATALGTEPRRFRLHNAAGFEVELLDLGATLRSIRVPTPAGPVETVLAYERLNQYRSDPYYLGATVGRYANRIAHARFDLDGQTRTLARTPGQRGHCLHGGREGFSRRPWSVASGGEHGGVSLRLVSPAGDQGFPGELLAETSYRLLDDFKLAIEFRAETDRPTVVNLANHAYFNLNSDGAPADNHRVRIHADRYIPVAEDLIPTGEFRAVGGTPFDFRTPAAFAERLSLADPQLRHGAGFDHNYVLDRGAEAVRPAAELASPQSGLSLRVLTDQPGLQFYGGQHLAAPFGPLAGVCLEAQDFPNAPNTPGFPPALLYPGQVYRRVTIYEFRWRAPA